MFTNWKRRLSASVLTLPMLMACGDNRGDRADTTMAMSDSAAGAMAAMGNSDRDMVQLLATANGSEIEAARVALQKARNADVRAFAQRMIDEHSRGMQMLSDLSGRSGWQLPDTMWMSQDRTTTIGTPSGATGTGGAASGMGATGTNMQSDTMNRGGQPGTGLGTGGATSQQGGLNNTALMDAVVQLQTQHRSMMQQLENASGTAFDNSYIQGQVLAHQRVLDLIRQFSSQVQSSELRTQLNEAESMVSQHLQRAQELQQRTGTLSDAM